MMESNRDFKFVTVQKPGQRPDPHEVFALRSHVRQSIALEKKDRLKRRQPRPRLVPKPSSHKDDTCPHRRVASRMKSEEADAQTWPSLVLPKAPVVFHPFASIAADHVRLPIERLDYLFKSPIFRQVVEPGFSASHVDSTRSLQVGLPGCFEDGAFLQALVHSMVQASNGGQQTTEQLRLHVEAIAALNKKLADQSKGLSLSTLGAIMALRGAAYKRGDHNSHEQHVRGLSRALDSVTRPLTLSIRMALLFQDLYASVLIIAPSHLDITYLSSSIKWARNHAAVLRLLPPGFQRHRKVLPLPITGVIQDLIQLNEVVVVRPSGSDESHKGTNCSQSSRERRLSFQSQSPPGMDVIAGAVRLAAFILTYVTHWQNNGFSQIPGLLAQQLIDLLEVDLSVTMTAVVDCKDNGWMERRDLQLWLLFIGLNTVHLHEPANNSLRARYAEALRIIRLRIISSSIRCLDDDHKVVEPANVLEAAMQDYIYVKGWLECRSSLEEWQRLESPLTSKALLPPSGT